MKYLISLILSIGVCLSAWADNFIIHHGEAVKLFCQRVPSTPIERADQLFEQDYHEVFGEYLVHTNNIFDAKIIVATYDNADLKRYARIRGISFDQLADHHGAFMLKVHNNGRQLFVVGSDEQGAAFGLMTLSRQWGVSPFRWWADAPALPMDVYELGVAYEELFEASVPVRTLILDGAQPHDKYLQELLLRLRATGVTDFSNATDETSEGVFRWTLKPASMPYLGLSLALDDPEHIRLEGLRAYDYGRKKEWQMHWMHQLGGELQLLLFFDMAWEINNYRKPYSVEELEDLHYTQMSGVNCNWSQLWNDYFDLAMTFHPEQPHSFEALRRAIGECQNLQLQLSLELNDKVVPNDHTNAFFRTIEYPLNMMTTQMQRLCNMQLVEHDAAKQWAVEDGRQRMSLLAAELPALVEPKWRQMLGGVVMPDIEMDHSLMQLDQHDVMTPMQVGSLSSLPSDDSTDLLYRSRRALGNHVEPFEALRLPLVYQADSVHLRVWLLPTRSYGKTMNCMISIDMGEPQLLRIDQENVDKPQQVFDLVFAIDPTIDQHDIVLRTTSDAIFLQRIWLTDIK
ncbi:MAG: hypothetical protein IKX59_03360 [Bacteroidales bacterium]|nr:hypothetical protein [Bacteroidales bacterium]